MMQIRTILDLEKLTDGTDGIEASLDRADNATEEDDRRYTHEEVSSNLRRRIND